jgi:hypothetical protein
VSPRNKLLWFVFGFAISALSIGVLGSLNSAQKPTSLLEVCPPGFKRFSCKFYRLCVSPGAKQLEYWEQNRLNEVADCTSDTLRRGVERMVPEENTRSSPYDVGFAAGVRILGPRYLGVAFLYPTDTDLGKFEESINRVLVAPLPKDASLEYDRGFHDGLVAYDDFLQQTKQKAKQIEGAERPH